MSQFIGREQETNCTDETEWGTHYFKRHDGHLYLNTFSEQTSQHTELADGSLIANSNRSYSLYTRENLQKSENVYLIKVIHCYVGIGAMHDLLPIHHQLER